VANNQWQDIEHAGRVSCPHEDDRVRRGRDSGWNRAAWYDHRQSSCLDTAPLMQTAHLPGPVGGLGLAEEGIQRRDELRHAPALRRGEHQAPVLGVLLHQHREIVGVEGKQHPPLRGGAQELLRI
jgi:hypothetical protein